MKLAVLTSGGDAPGMNAAVRAVVRAGLARGLEVYAVHEGYQGLVEGGARMTAATWSDVAGILERGGTALGTARCAAFRTREGRVMAAGNLLARGIDALVVIGGDGSLTGAELLYTEWVSLSAELVEQGAIDAATAAAHPALRVVGIVGSIDNDMAGTDVTLGTDSALNRITEAMDAISSTAQSHKRTFVIEVMGRNCGYLALMSGLANGADAVFIPEAPPPAETWRDTLVASLAEGRESGRRNSTVIVAEGARDDSGCPISAIEIRDLLEREAGVEARLTVLGHVQRGGPPSAFDRNLGTLLGQAAIDAFTDTREAMTAPIVVGMRGNRIVRLALSDSLAANRGVTEAIDARDYQRAMTLRGAGFARSHGLLQTIVQVRPTPPPPGSRRLRLAVLTAGAPAPGMNAAVRAAVRLGRELGHDVLGVPNGFTGLIEGRLEPLDWMSVSGWASRGGSELGTRRSTLQGRDVYAIARTVEEEELDGLLVIGGWSAYLAAQTLHQQREHYPTLALPIVCLPATINNNIPCCDLSVGADTALNAIVGAVDKIRQSASAQQRCFVVEVMGRRCGYLATMSGLATGAERAYIHEEGVSIASLMTDLDRLRRGFESGRRLGLVIRSEGANDAYDARFMGQLLEEEGGDLFDVRVSILGHLQQGGQPSPFDRLAATRMGGLCVDYLVTHALAGEGVGSFIGVEGGVTRFHDLGDLSKLVDTKHQRPKEQWWMGLRDIARTLTSP